MIRINTNEDNVILEYFPDGGTYFLEELFKTKSYYSIKGIFKIEPKHIVKKDDEDWRNIYKADGIDIVIGNKVNDYYEIDNEIVDTKPYKVFFHESIDIREKYFVAQTNISILSKLAKIVKKDIYIGLNDKADSIPKEIMNNLVKTFPNSIELKKYADARVDKILRDYTTLPCEYALKYEKYLTAKTNKYTDTKPKTSPVIIEAIKRSEVAKYSFCLEKLKEMLKMESAYSEDDWQKEITDILCLIYPQYIKAIPKARIKIVDSTKDRIPDYFLITTSGILDIAEIKKSTTKIMSSGQYRQNYTASTELTGAIMQVEKYIYFLNKWGKAGEDKINDKYKTELPANFHIRVCNPRGIIIMGRSEGLNQQQKQDYEIIKRKYKNMIDCITYDELVERLELLVEKFRV